MSVGSPWEAWPQMIRSVIVMVVVTSNFHGHDCNY
jgi:hypothetical protein